MKKSGVSGEEKWGGEGSPDDIVSARNGVTITGGALGDPQFFCLLYLKVLFTHDCSRRVSKIRHRIHWASSPRHHSPHFKEIR